MRRIAIIAGALASLSLAGGPVLAQTAGKGGTGVDENTELPRCAQPLGVVALVEEKAPSPTDGLAGELSPGMAALLRMAEAQQGGGTARVDPLPLIKLMAARSNCFRVADRGAAMGALERERTMTGAAPSQSLVKADYLISAQVLYSDAKSRESGGGIGGAFGSAVGLKTKTLESQVLLSLIDVDTGLQEAVATGSARKKDVGVVGGGLLLGLGVGALGGTYGSTDIGKITSIAVLDAFRKLILEAQARLPQQTVSASQPTAQAATDQTQGAVDDPQGQ
jgi:curli biogenesis system outer membrane secretion channel CsgG